MIPSKLTLANFTSYSNSVPTLDFTKFQLAAISGQNGAGKSSLLDAITWCLWGVSRLGDSSDQLVRLGQQNMEVEFSFELDGHIYTVKRKRALKSGGTSSLEFFSGSSANGETMHNLTEGTIKATQQKIIDTLHLSYETFVNSAFLRQGHADEFTTKGPMDRKRILADILGLAHYDLLEEKAKEKLKDLQGGIRLLDYKLLEIEAELTGGENQAEKKVQTEEKISALEKDIKDLEKQNKILQDERASLLIIQEQKVKLLQNYQQNKQELDQMLQQGKKRKETIEKLEQEIEGLKGAGVKLNELTKLQQEKEKLDEQKKLQLETEKEISEVSSNLKLKQQKKSQLQQEIDQICSQLKSLEKPSAKCPTCGQEVDQQHKIKVKKELTDKQTLFESELKKIETNTEELKIKELSKKLAGYSYDHQRYLTIQSQLQKLAEAQQQKELLTTKEATLISEKNTQKELRELFVKKQSQVEKLSQEVKGTIDVEDKVNQVNQSLAEVEKKLEELRLEEKGERDTLGQIRELISRADQMAKIKKQKQEEKIALSNQAEAFEELAQAFGKKGIQAMIIETAIPEIEDETNRLLEKLTEGRMKVRFETQRETKNKVVGGERGIIETLDIIISDEMGERPYEGYSGGEQFRVNFAIRLALSKLLTHRAGSKLQFLVIDEGFGTQDAQGRSRIVEALDVIKNDFAKILVITHLDELKEEFPTRIEVQKTPTGSTFEVVGI